MCADAHLPSNQFSDLIAETEVSYTRLAHNQTHAGYTAVILKRHVVELYQLPAAERAAFMDDVARASQAVDELFHPVKLDVMMMGHLCPHLHCHVFPQYPDGDPATLIDIAEGHVRLPADEQRQRVSLIRDRLQS
jgi:diadenosine tetraphosphate (Ap4A) HIT family hydrolase